MEISKHEQETIPSLVNSSELRDELLDVIERHATDKKKLKLFKVVYDKNNKPKSITMEWHFIKLKTL